MDIRLKFVQGVQAALALAGRGGSLPGAIALKLDPHFLEKFVGAAGTAVIIIILDPINGVGHFDDLNIPFVGNAVVQIAVAVRHKYIILGHHGFTPCRIQYNHFT